MIQIIIPEAGLHLAVDHREDLRHDRSRPAELAHRVQVEAPPALLPAEGEARRRERERTPGYVYARIHPDAGGALAAVATGVCGLGGAYFFLLALERGKASIIVPFTALYPLITLALSVLLLGERPSPANLVGIAFAIVAVALLSSG